jgi:pimeloyl-ACP methyl ester carboxylesterase
MMNRRKLIGAAAAGAALPLLNRVAIAQTSPKTKNVVFVHGLFADGSCWSKVIARLQQKGVNCTSVQNPLTSLHEASEAARRAIAAQPGPTVLVGHSFSGMIVTDVGVDPKVTADPVRRFFRRGFPDCAVASVGPWRPINDTDIRSFASKIRFRNRRHRKAPQRVSEPDSSASHQRRCELSSVRGRLPRIPPFVQAGECGEASRGAGRRLRAATVASSSRLSSNARQLVARPASGMMTTST